MNLSRTWFVRLKEEFVLYIQPSGYKCDFFYYIFIFVHIWPFAVFNAGEKMVGHGALNYLLLFMQVISVALISF